MTDRDAPDETEPGRPRSTVSGAPSGSRLPGSSTRARHRHDPQLVFVSAFGFYVASDPAAAQEYARDFGVSAFIAGSVGRALEASGRGRWLALVIGLVASSAYGALGVAVVALAWLYFSGRAVVAGAVLNVTLWERHVARNAGSCPRDEAGGTRARKDLRP